MSVLMSDLLRLVDKHLTRRQAQIVKLRHIDKYKYAEIGEMFGISDVHARNICQKSLARLKKLVRKRG